MKETSGREDRVGDPVPIVRRGQWIELQMSVVWFSRYRESELMADEQRSKPFHPILEWILAAA